MSSIAYKLRLLTYNPHLQALARALHASALLRKVYFRLTAESGNVLRMNLMNVGALFHRCSVLEYRNLESWLMRSEGDFLKALLSSLGEGDVFLDVGSHIGQFTVPVSRAVGERGLVIAVEPEDNACRELERNLRLNVASNVRILRVALGDQSGEALLAWSGGSCPSLLHGPVKTGETLSTSPFDSSTGSQAVTLEVGDEVMERERLPIPKAVKIDVEGYEYHVLCGLARTLRSPSCKLLCCEIHPCFLPPRSLA